MTIPIGANLMYTFQLTNEQIALVTKALVGKLRDCDLEKAEVLAFDMLSARTGLLRTKLDAAIHAEEKAKEP